MHLTRRAHAKLNLALSVGPPEPPTSLNPGMHPISSWMHAIELHDTVDLTWTGQSSDFKVQWASDAPRPSPIDWPAEKDLAVRALRSLEQTVGRALPISIRIDKRIPVGGGLGGGSSDAAAVLVGVNELLSLGLARDTLVRLSTSLGSDVAYFIDDVPPAPALVRGTGDRIARLARRSAGRPVILVFPAFGCPTGPVYKAYDSLRSRPLRDTGVEALTIAPDLSGAPLFNDLLAPAESIQPALAPLRAAIQNAAGLQVHMSGSGSTLFLLPASHEAELTAKIRSQVADISVLVTRLI